MCGSETGPDLDKWYVVVLNLDPGSCKTASLAFESQAGCGSAAWAVQLVKQIRISDGATTGSIADSKGGDIGLVIGPGQLGPMLPHCP